MNLGRAMIFEMLTAEHVVKMGPLVDIHAGFDLTPGIALDLEALGGMAAVRDNGEVIAIAGILPRWNGVGLAWAWLSLGWRRHARAITEKIIETLDDSDLHRVELAVKCGFDRGGAWAERLGFELETPCAVAWGPNGENFSIYRRIR